MLAKAKCSSMREDSLTEGRRWLEQATVDLRWAEDLAERGGDHLACCLPGENRSYLWRGTGGAAQTPQGAVAFHGLVVKALRESQSI